MYVTDDVIRSWEARYGRPESWEHVQPTSREEFDFIRSTQRDGRSHDITLYIERDGQFAVTAKHHYSQGMYRTPSGGLTPGETLEDGAAREAWEETGLSIELGQHLLRVQVGFQCDDDVINWTTHVFHAIATSDEVEPHDLREIREARWAWPSEFPRFGELMRQTDSAGLHYRALLHEQVAPLIPLFKTP